MIISLERRFALSLLLCCSIACAQSVQPKEKPVAPPEPVAYQRTIVDRSRPSVTAVDVPLAEGKRIVTAVYRARPDRRFVHAVTDVVELAGGTSSSQTTIGFAEGKWRIADAVALPELATFDDALRELTRWASAQKRAAPAAVAADALAAIDADIEKFYPRFLFSALRRLDAAGRAGTLDGAAMRRAARASALLAVQTHDDFEIADSLAARALAIVATAKSLDAKCCREEEALLTYSFGYRTEAEKSARSLPEGSLARAVILGGKADGEAGRWAALRKSMRAVQPANLDREAVPLLFERPSIDHYAAISASVAGELALSMTGRNESVAISGESITPGASPITPQVLRTFESQLDQRTKADATSLLDERSIRSYYEALFYSALYFQYLDLHERLGLPDEVKKLTEILQPRSATGTNVLAWMRHASGATYGRQPNIRVKDFLGSTSLVGGVRRYDLIEALRKSLGGIHPKVREVARELAMTTDSRPAELWAAGRIADIIGHLRNRQLFVRTALARGSKACCGSLAELLFDGGDVAALRELAEDATQEPQERMNALYYLDFLGDESLHSLFERAIAATGYDPGSAYAYLDYLDKQNDAKSKERFMRLLLAKNPHLDPISQANLTAWLADALERQARYAEAWKLVEPEVKVYSAYILASATSLLQRLGRDEEALDLGRQLVERYPSADSRADFAKVLWRMRRHAEAAKLFDPSENANALATAQRDLPKAFIETFSDKELDEAVRAYEELIRAGLPASLLSFFSSWASTSGRHALALAVEERFQKIQYTGMDRSIQQANARTGYLAAREVHGEKAAIEWFLRHSPPADEMQLFGTLLSNDERDLIIGVAEARPPAGMAAASILGAAMVMDRVPGADPRWNLVNAAMGPRPTSGDNRAIYAAVQHAQGRATAEEVAAADDSRNGRTIAAYFLGISSAAEGRYDDALDELLVAGEGPAGYPPASFAISKLYIWRAKRLPWDELARQKIL